MSPTPGPTPPHAPLDPAGTEAIIEKLRILRLIRALDRARVAPDRVPALRTPLVRLAEVDELLTAVLELLDRVRSADSDEGEMRMLAPLLQICEQVRGEVLDALHPRDQEAVRRASGEVVVTEAEVWLEVEGLRRRPKRGSRRASRPMDDEEAQEAAAKAMASTRLRRPPGAEKVAAQERAALPDDLAPLQAWLAWLPAPWVRAVARIHDLDPAQEPRALVAALAARLCQPAWLQRFLAERLGSPEREVLMAILEYPGVALGRGPKSLVGTFAVHWDWEGGVPATSGGRLRSAGLVYVGARRGRRVATVPPALRPLLTAALKHVDPGLLDMPDRARRIQAAEALQHAPHVDAELERWKEHDRAFSRWIQKHGLRDRSTSAAIAAYFGGGPREVYSEAESTALVEFAVLDYRAEPGAPTAAERLLGEQPLRDADAQAVARAIAAARSALYRIESLRRGRDLTFRPVWPAGEPVVVTDRAASLTAEEGWLFAARLYQAGPYTFFRWLSDPLPAGRERRILLELERMRTAAKAEGHADSAAFLAAHPEALVYAMRTAAR